MLLYIISIYLFSSQSGGNDLSNFLALALISLIWFEILLLRKKFVFNKFLFIYLLFIIVCMISVFYAIEPNTSIVKVKTLILIYLLMLTFINYVDRFERLDYIMKCFVYSGFIASIYILINADFTALERLGGELGNVNGTGMIIGISSIFCLHYLLKTKNKWYALIIITNLIVILLTGSRKSLLFIMISIVLLLIFQESGNLGSKVKALLISIAIIFTAFYVINNVPIFYEIIGKRIVNLLSFFSSDGTTEVSMNTRSNMIQLGWRWFIERPFSGYGIDNYRYLFSSNGGGISTYSHNNVIELLVGTGVVGTTLFYLSNLIVIKDLLKASKIITKTVCYSFLLIISGYLYMSVGLIYYYDKHISIVLALGSIIYKLANVKKTSQ